MFPNKQGMFIPSNEPSGKQILGGREISLLVDGAEIQMWSVLFVFVSVEEFGLYFVTMVCPGL